MNDPEIHADEDVLNEYLDGELSPSGCSSLEAHLARCPDCTRRLDALRELFANVQGLPEEALSRDLAPGVLRGLSRRRVSWRVLDLTLAGQAILALVLAVLAWPTLAQQAAVYAAFGLEGWQVPLAAWSGSFNQVSQAASALFDRGMRFDWPPGLFARVSSSEILVIFSVISVLWLVGNGLLLGPRTRAGLHRRNP